jgi:cytochrome P450
MLNIHGAHHHKGYWDNPEVFDPLRFNDAADAGGAADAADRVQFRAYSPAFFPFGYRYAGRMDEWMDGRMHEWMMHGRMN